MFCENCGTRMEESDRFCPKCGHQVSMPVAARNAEVPDDATQLSPSGESEAFDDGTTVEGEGADTTVPGGDSTVPSSAPSPQTPPPPSYDYPSPVGEAPTGSLPVVHDNIPHFTYGDDQTALSPNEGTAATSPAPSPYAQGGQTPSTPMYAQPVGAGAAPTTAGSAAGAGATPMTPQPIPSGVPAAAGTSGTAGTVPARRSTGLLLGGIISSAALLAILVVALVWFLVIKPHMDSAATTPVASSTQSQSQTDKDSSGSGSSKDGSSGGSSDKSGSGSKDSSGQAAKACTKMPDLTVTGASVSGGSLSVELSVEAASSCPSGESLQLDNASTQITVSDSNGTAAAAVFDFSGDPVVADPGDSATITAKFGKGQFWRMPSEYSPDSSSLTATAKTVKTKGSSSSSKPYTGAQADNGVREAGAKAGIEWQIAHDQSKADRFMTTITTQLSSKQLNMQAEGKTWSYQDIYQQYLDLQQQWPNALMLWSGDWPTYTKTDTSDYYVIISGESFGSVQGGWDWCSSEGFGPDDCLPVDLQ